MKFYTPHRWVVLEMCYNGKTTYKVFAGWYGGFTEGDSWKLNSGIVKAQYTQHGINFTGHTGSVYECHTNKYAMSSYMATVLQGWLSKIDPNVGKITVLEQDSLEQALKQFT